MDVAATAAGAGVAPWIVLGVVLGLALASVVALGAVALRRPRRPAEPAPTVDDLPGFREAPPGFPGARRLPTAGWVSLAAPAAPPPAEDRPVRLLAALAAGGLLLIGTAALVAGLAPASVGRTPPSTAADRDQVGGVLAEVSFEGLVLERRAVGVTATTPRLRLTTVGAARAQVTLPAWNCLADEAPADPATADCARTETEYAEVSGAALDVDRDGDALRISGSFPTSTRPNGGPPEETGHVYALTFTLRPDGDGGATGEVRLGDDTAPAVDEPGVNVLRSTD